MQPQIGRESRQQDTHHVELRSVSKRFGDLTVIQNVDLSVGNQMLRARTKRGFVPGPGEPVWARIDPAQAHFFNTATGLSLGIRL